ncbi:glycosyltransferase family 4 protein [Maribellus sp. CM-23]|uniref:glycosyltransferase family 4 protein n=1 Tax=Maribellus sp. CM-23 TaxID=2781026 RepID=UPI001F3A0315|nr:glycosyltransferase family 4 protein [Maribellus sp. CM-23]MCE4566487.1 glycosyltransferase family 4 protein [Maribellus sp. CM-23]
MRIAVVSTARSHLLDVAIALENEGHNVIFYTAMPKKRCEKFGFSPTNVISFFPLIGLLFIHRKISFKYKLKPFLISILDDLLDRLTSLSLKKCDILIGSSVIAVKSSIKARKKYGAYIITDCGTKHVIEQDAVLKHVPQARSIYKTVIQNELVNYDYADKIVVPSHHSFDSFVKHNIDPSKILINPYGVNTKMFYPTMKLKAEKFDVIIVGSWRYIKGCDILADACLNKLKVRLLHVGPIFGDLPLPSSPLFTHIEPIPQHELIEYYKVSKIFVLPSRAEGLALVQAQAMVCGLPIVYSYDTGGTNLKELIGGSDFMFQTPDLNADNLANTIKLALEKSNEQRVGVLRDYVGKSIENLTWEAYGNRYSKFLNTLQTGKN